MRFSHDELKPFLSKMSVKQHDFKHYLFPDNQVCIILAGAVEITFHRHTASKPELIGKFTAGDVIGFEAGDRGITTNVQAWTYCVSQVEAIWMETTDFAQLWAKQQKNAAKRIFYESLKLQSMFRRLNENTLHLLAFELLEERVFKQGMVIVHQNRRSKMNKRHALFNKRQTNAILVKILEQRRILDMGGKDLATSTFGLALKEVAKHARQMLTQESTTTMTLHSTLDTERQHKPVEIAEIMPRRMRKDIRSLFSVEEHACDKGVFIIETGKCTIVNEGHPEPVFTEIYRSSVFGESSHLEVAGLDYFGDIIAGSMTTKERMDVVCLYLSEANFQRVPYHELKTAFKAQMEELDMY